MRRAAWCAGVGGDEAFCRVSGHVLRRRATSERGGSRGGWDWGDWGWGEDPASSGIGIGVIGVGARARLGRAPREGMRGAPGWGGGAAAGAWCLASRSASCDAASHPTHMDVASAHHHTHPACARDRGAVTP